MIKLQKSTTAAIDTIRAAIDDAMSAAEVAVNKAIHVGQLLIETKPTVGHGNFQEFIREHFPRISYDTAHRWMQAAERTVAAIGLDASTIDVPISTLLITSGEELSPESRKAQQTLFEFMADKTIKDCTAGVVRDGDEPHRITRAANGKKAAQTSGEDRKQWGFFISRQLSEMQTNLDALAKGRGKRPAEYQKMMSAFRSAVLGGPLQINPQGNTKHCPGWPVEVCELVRDLLNERLRQRKG